MPLLFIYPKKGDPFQFVLENKRISIGRSGDNGIALNDPFCSGYHAHIYPAKDGYMICDNESKNGTFLNGNKITFETELKRGDEILVGSTRVVFDKKLSTNVELTDTPSSSANINTIMHLEDILKRPGMTTTVRALPKKVDLESLEAEQRSISVISDVSQALVSHRPIAELLEFIMDLISENLAMDRAVMMIKEGNPPQMMSKVVRVKSAGLRNQKILVSQSIVNTVVQEHAAVIISDVQSDPRFMAQESIIQLNIHSAMCVPLWNNRNIIGIIYADRISIPEKFTDEDLKLLTLLSNLAAVKIENAKLIEEAIEKEKMERELHLAADIQKDFLPKENPKIAEYDVAGTNIPCYQVGGDYYDFIPIDEDRMGYAIADVSGKGVSASLLMATLRAALLSQVYPEYDLEKMAKKLNNFVHLSSDINHFITFFYCEINNKTGKVRYINAGHNPPIIIGRKKNIHRLGPSGLCLGMFHSSSYEVREFQLNPGDSAVLYTDGITEGRNLAQEEYTEERLLEYSRTHIDLPARQLVENICGELKSFTLGTDPMDDMTIVVIKRQI
jgi:sigma-B regulation protein RsbU (phosphoserine phosphatase)